MNHVLKGIKANIINNIGIGLQWGCLHIGKPYELCFKMS